MKFEFMAECRLLNGFCLRDGKLRPSTWFDCADKVERDNLIMIATIHCIILDTRKSPQNTFDWFLLHLVAEPIKWTYRWRLLALNFNVSLHMMRVERWLIRRFRAVDFFLALTLMMRWLRGSPQKWFLKNDFQTADIDSWHVTFHSNFY